MPLGTEVGLGSDHTVLDGDPAPLHGKGQSSLRFGPCLLWPNGWMNQDTAWYRGKPRPKPHCVGWGHSSPEKGAQHAPTLAQTARWIKMPLDLEVGLSPGDFVLDGDPAPLSPKGAQTSNFRPISVAAKWLHGSRCHLPWG